MVKNVNVEAGRRILGIFAKWPESGKVKTRLAQAVSPQWAAEIARAFLLDTLHRLRDLPVEKVVVFAPSSQQAAFAALIPPGLSLAPQVDGNLGERLHAFFADTHDPTVVIGTDSPSLPVSLIDQAFQSLQTVDVVIGPATDGGYYLLGCRGHHPALFHGIDWSTSRVTQQTTERLRQLGLSLAVLPPWYDVDTSDDWQTLLGHLAAMQLAGVDAQMPHTLKLVADSVLGERSGHLQA